MNILKVIDQVKAKCPTFGNRVAGAAEYENLRNVSNMTIPAAYVIPLDDNVGEQSTDNSYLQSLTDAFAVIVVMNNRNDERGQDAINAVQQLRKELHKALLGFDLSDDDYDYDGIVYQGGNLLFMDRQRLDYQFEFSAQTTIDVNDTSLADDYDNLPAFESVNIEIDHKDLPPDGTVDHTLDIPLPQ